MYGCWFGWGGYHFYHNNWGAVVAQWCNTLLQSKTLEIAGLNPTGCGLTSSLLYPITNSSLIQVPHGVPTFLIFLFKNMLRPAARGKASLIFKDWAKKYHKNWIHAWIGLWPLNSGPKLILETRLIGISLVMYSFLPRTSLTWKIRERGKRAETNDRATEKSFFGEIKRRHDSSEAKKEATGWDKSSCFFPHRSYFLWTGSN